MRRGGEGGRVGYGMRRPAGRGMAVAGCNPDEMGIGPAAAIPAALSAVGMPISQVDVFEVNEAFASQALYCVKKLGVPMEKLNPKGGAIALGRPEAPPRRRRGGHRAGTPHGAGPPHVRRLHRIEGSKQVRAARVAQHLPRRAASREAEVDDPDVAVGVEQQVLRFDISMDDVLRVEVLDARDDLQEEATPLVLAAAAVPHDVLEELAAVGELHREVDAVRVGCTALVDLLGKLKHGRHLA